MFKHALKPGLILAAAGIAWNLIFYIIGFGTAQWPGFVFIPILIALTVYFGIKVRNEELGGKMTFGQGFGWTFFALMISTLVSSVFNFFYFKYINTELIPARFDDQLEQMSETMSEEQIEAALGSMEPFFSAGFFVAVGIIIGLIFSLILGLIIGAIIKNE